MENKLSESSSGENIVKDENNKKEENNSIFDFFEKIAEGIKEIKEDVSSIMERDPAATSEAEVLLLYSGLHAVAAYRVAHKLDEKGMKIAARAISQAAKFFTDIEIHPSAKIGKRLFIDHGAGVVIGETAEIGDDCTIYQGVTLGGTGKHVGKRHPTIGNNVMIGAGAKVLGPFKVGDNSKIAAGAVVLNEIPEGSTAVGMPARVVKREGAKQDETCTADLDQIHIPDPVAQELCRLQQRIEELEKRLDQKEKRKGTKKDADI